MRYYAFGIVLAVVLIAGCGSSDKPRFTPEQLEAIPLPQRTALPSPSGGIVLKIEGQTITAQEII